MSCGSFVWKNYITIMRRYFYNFGFIFLALALSCACTKSSPDTPDTPDDPSDETVEVTDVTLDRNSYEMFVGDTFTLEATVLPEDADDKTVTWSSSDEGILTVEDGLVTAVAAGTATVTAQAGEASDVCEVVVKEKSMVFVPDVAASGYQSVAFSDSQGNDLLDGAMVWLRSEDYTLTPDPNYLGNIGQTGRELQINLNVTPGSWKTIPEGTYDIVDLYDYDLDNKVPFTAFSYYINDIYELGCFYADYDTGEYFKPVDGSIEVKRSGDAYVLNVVMYDENGKEFVCDWEGELLFDLNPFYKYF